MLAKSYVDLYGNKLTKKVIKSIKTMNQVEEEIKRENKKRKAHKEDERKQNEQKEKKKHGKYVNNQPKSSSGVKTIKKTAGKKTNHKIQPMKKR